MKVKLSVLIASKVMFRIWGFATICTEEFKQDGKGQMYFDAGKWLGKAYFDPEQEIEYNGEGEFRMVLTYRNKTSARKAEVRPMFRDEGQTFEEFMAIAEGRFQLFPWLPEPVDPWAKFFAKIRREPVDTRCIDELMATAD